MKKNKSMVMILSLVAALMLSACVSERGVREHMAKGKAMPAGVISGMVWEAKVHGAGGDEKVLGHFESRGECHHAVMMHKEAHAASQSGDMVSSCTATPSN